MTIDRWDAPENYENMRNRFAAEFEQLDRICEAFTESETRLGAFEEL